MTQRAAVGLIVAHMALFELTAAVDCVATATFLYLLVPFMAYLLLNKWAAIGLAVLYSVWFSTYFRLFRSDPFEVLNDVQMRRRWVLALVLAVLAS